MKTGDSGAAAGTGGVRRLSDATRALAARALAGEHGRAMKPADFAISPEFFLSIPTPNRHYAEAVRLIAERAPLRVVDGEKIVGSATLLEAAFHRVPLTLYGSISHTTLGFDGALRVGYRGLRSRIEARLARGCDEGGRDLLESMLLCLDAAGLWHRRYVDLVTERIASSRGTAQEEWRNVLGSLERVPENPPRTFREAVQALWLLWDFQRLCGNWSGVGRFDLMLGGYLRNDLAAGRITLDEARELIAHFWIKGCEWIGAGGDRRGSGDAQFYQNIVLGGVDAEGNDAVNEITFLVLDVVEELHISDFPIAVRISSKTPEALLRRIAAVQRLGGGIVAVYNDERIVPMLEAFGYPAAEARDYANDGCWELIVPGKTSFGYRNIDILAALQEAVGATPETAAVPDFPDFDALYRAFEVATARRITEVVNETYLGAGLPSKHPTPLLSILVEDCIERGRSYTEFGPVYTVRAPHASGLQDAANSLLVMKRLVFEERTMTLGELVGIVRADWSGYETLRRAVRRRFEFYGNDAAEADAMVRRCYDSFTGMVGRVGERFGVLRPAGISTFGREMSEFRAVRLATASGEHKGDILAGNFSPTPGSDRHGPTAVIRSHCSVDLGRLPSGTALDLKVVPSSVEGEAGLAALAGLMKTFVSLGGIFMQIDVVDTALLRDAQAHPEKYPNLSVRISGWSARFATLDRDWQDLIIVRTQQHL